jgi:hypothetical protein
MVTKGVNFDKEKSCRFALWIIVFVSVSTFSSFIHDPLHRELADDLQEERTWCLVRYSSTFEIYNSAINIFHFVIPFSINFISAFVIVVTAARNRTMVQKNKPYKEHLREQFHHLKHLLVSPVVLVVLAASRLVISFTSGCMKSGRDPWLFLMSYFISFVPPLLTFITFILPSKVYKKEFYNAIEAIRRTMRRE